ncbi:hypothetical protein BC332_02063 [Capsicum chinense]|nr:hypothetical protein BC332_02063 [Capsicum chinense]
MILVLTFQVAGGPGETWQGFLAALQLQHGLQLVLHRNANNLMNNTDSEYRNRKLLISSNRVNCSEWRSGCRDSLKMEKNAESKDAPVDDIKLKPEIMSDAPVKALPSLLYLLKALPSFVIMEREGHIIACASLFPYFEEKYGEVAAITVSPDSRGQGQRDKLLGVVTDCTMKTYPDGTFDVIYCRDTILHIQVEKGDLDNLHRKREQLEMQRRKAKAKLQAKAIEEDQGRAEVEAAAEAKRRREHDREAARQALLQVTKMKKEMKKVMDIDLT